MKPVCYLLLCYLALPLAAAEWPVTIDWQNKVTLSTPLTGRIGSVDVEVGDQVKQGQLLATLDARLFEAEVKSAQSILKRTRVTFEESERSFARAEELYDRTVLSTTDFQQAELEHAIATANYHNSQAQLTKAKVNREYTQLRAPFDAVILQRLINPGESVSNQCETRPMLVLAAMGQMSARGWLPGNALRGLETGQALDLVLQDQRLSATIKSIGTEFREENNTTRYLVEFLFQPPADTTILPGMRGQAIIP